MSGTPGDSGGSDAPGIGARGGPEVPADGPRAPEAQTPEAEASEADVFDAAPDDAARLRVVADQVASLTDASAVALHARLS